MSETGNNIPDSETFRLQDYPAQTARAGGPPFGNGLSRAMGKDNSPWYISAEYEGESIRIKLRLFWPSIPAAIILSFFWRYYRANRGE